MKAIDINKLKEEANRCFLCKVPKCKKYCPIDTQIPAVIQLFKENKIDSDFLNEETFSKFLFTAGQPVPDLLIRTS